MQIKKVSILGVGLLGGSIGLAAKSRINGCQIIGYGHRLATLQKAIEVGAIDIAAGSVGEAVRDADLIVLCTPVSLLADMARQVADSAKPEAVLTDVGSTKQSVVEAAERVWPRFVGSHPMAGSEKRGVEFARTDLFEGALCILTPTPQTEPAILLQVDEFWRTLGMRTTNLDPAEHDRLLASVSHLPHALAAALITMQDDAALPLAGKGFLDATRIAGGDGGLWRDILQDNRDAVKSSLARLRQELDRIESMLQNGRGADLAKWLDTAAQRRAALLQEKLSEMTPD